MVLRNSKWDIQHKQFETFLALTQLGRVNQSLLIRELK